MANSSSTSMQYVRFGKTGLKVSRVCLGCMSYGSSKWGKWIKDEEESLELIGKAYAAGINFFDTANMYSNGESEIVLGKAIKKLNMPRGNIVVATKVRFPVRPGEPAGFPDNLNTIELVNAYGLSRKHIFDAIDASLERLQLSYVDLYQIHRFDPETPIEETMEALHDIVKAGKVRYIGASSMPAWQFQKANAIAEKNGWTKFVSMQNRYNLLYREEEREMMPYCADQGIAVIPWSPLAMGILTGKDRKTEREKTLGRFNDAYGRDAEVQDEIVDRVASLAQKKGVTPAQIALAWMYTKPYVTSPIVGIGKDSHLQDAVGALSVQLTDDDVKYLEEPYLPRRVMNF